MATPDLMSMIQPTMIMMMLMAKSPSINDANDMALLQMLFHAALISIAKLTRSSTYGKQRTWDQV